MADSLSGTRHLRPFNRPVNLTPQNNLDLRLERCRRKEISERVTEISERVTVRADAMRAAHRDTPAAARRSAASATASGRGREPSPEDPDAAAGDTCATTRRPLLARTAGLTHRPITDRNSCRVICTLVESFAYALNWASSDSPTGTRTPRPGSGDDAASSRSAPSFPITSTNRSKNTDSPTHYFLSVRLNVQVMCSNVCTPTSSQPQRTDNHADMPQRKGNK